MQVSSDDKIIPFLGGDEMLFISAESLQSKGWTMKLRWGQDLSLINTWREEPQGGVLPWCKQYVHSCWVYGCAFVSDVLPVFGNFCLWVYKQVLSHQDLSLFKETAASQSSCSSLPRHLWVPELQWKGMGPLSNLFLKSYLWGSHKWWYMYLEQRIRAGSAESYPLGLLGMLMSVFKLDAWAFSSICLLAGLVSCKTSWEWE